MTDAERAAFLRGFELAQPPGPEELDALKVAKEIARSVPGHFRVAVSKPLGKAILAEIDSLPEPEAAAAWMGFIRGLIAQAGAAPVHVHESGRA